MTREIDACRPAPRWKPASMPATTPRPDRQRGRDERDLERDARAVDDAREDVAPDRVDAEQERRGRARSASRSWGRASRGTARSGGWPRSFTIHGAKTAIEDLEHDEAERDEGDPVLLEPLPEELERRAARDRRGLSLRRAARARPRGPDRRSSSSVDPAARPPVAAAKSIQPRCTRSAGPADPAERRSLVRSRSGVRRNGSILRSDDAVAGGTPGEPHAPYGSRVARGSYERSMPRSSAISRSTCTTPGDLLVEAVELEHRCRQEGHLLTLRQRMAALPRRSRSRSRSPVRPAARRRRASVASTPSVVFGSGSMPASSARCRRRRQSSDRTIGRGERRLSRRLGRRALGDPHLDARPARRGRRAAPCARRRPRPARAAPRGRCGRPRAAPRADPAGNPRPSSSTTSTSSPFALGEADCRPRSRPRAARRSREARARPRRRADPAACAAGAVQVEPQPAASAGGGLLRDGAERGLEPRRLEDVGVEVEDRLAELPRRGDERGVRPREGRVRDRLARLLQLVPGGEEVLDGVVVQRLGERLALALLRLERVASAGASGRRRAATRARYAARAGARAGRTPPRSRRGIRPG